MAVDFNSGLIGTLIGGLITVLSNWSASASKRRADEDARRDGYLHDMEKLKQERKFKLEDQERDQQKALESSDAEEDKYWFDKANKFRALEAEIFIATTRDEGVRALENFRDFLRENPPYLSRGDNLAFFYKFCTSNFIEEHWELGASHPSKQAYVMELQKFKIPTGEDIRKLRSAKNW